MDSNESTFHKIPLVKKYVVKKNDKSLSIGLGFALISNFLNFVFANIYINMPVTKNANVEIIKGAPEIAPIPIS